MARTPKRSPLEAFERNISDAEALRVYANALENRRVRRMRKELRVKVGEALRFPVGRRDELDCLESEDLFVVFKPDSNLSRDSFADLRPLLRQAVVAACAALETYVADKAMERVGSALRSDEPPRRLRDIPLSVGDWLDIEGNYERKGWGVRRVVEEYLRELSSTAPSQVGKVLAAVGVANWARQVDQIRGVAPGTSVRQLEEISDRRDLIAHTGDRRGQGRAQIQVDEVENILEVVREVALAIDEVCTSS